MITRKKFGTGTLILAILLVSIALVPAVSAIDNRLDTKENNTDNIHCAEKDIISKLSSNQSSSENLKKAEELRDKIKAQNEQEISDSVNKSTSKQLLTLSTVI